MALWEWGRKKLLQSGTLQQHFVYKLHLSEAEKIFLLLTQVRFEQFAPRIVFKPADGFFFNLSYTLPGQIEFQCDLLKC